MRSFTDNAGRTWTIAVNVNAIKRVRGLLGLDLLDLVGGGLLEKLFGDPVLLSDVVYAVCRPEADAKGVTDEDFGRAMAGDTIEHATKALLEELVDFSPSPRDRANLQRVLQTTWQALDKARDVITAKLATVDAEALVVQALATSGNSSGAAPESSASIPGR